MNKQEFLSKLSREELFLLKSIIPCDIVNEIENRKKKLNIEVENCFIYKVNQDELYLIKVKAFGDDNWFICDEINIYDENINYYETNYHINDFLKGWESLDPSMYEKIITLAKTRNDAIEKITIQFDNQIRELCSTLLNIQNKN